MIKFCNTIPDPADKYETDHFLSYLNLLIRESLSGGQMSNFGLLYCRFVDELRKYLKIDDDREVVVTSSGHTALMAAYHCLGVKKLLVPKYTYFATQSAAELQGIETELVDVDPLTGALSLDAVVGKEYDGMVLVTPLSSIPDLDLYSKFCKENNKKLIIDGAPTFGTPDIYNYGDAFCLSFHATKSFPVGEGGAVIYKLSKRDKQKKALKNLLSYITFGVSRKPKTGNERLDSVDGLSPQIINFVANGGLNAKVSEYTCAVGLALLGIVDDHLDRRRRNAIYLKGKLSKELGDAIKFLQSWKGDDTIYQSLPVYFTACDPSETVELIKHLHNNNVEAPKYYSLLGSHTIPVQDCCESGKLFATNVCLPVHSNVSLNDIDFMVDKVKEFFDV